MRAREGSGWALNAFDWCREWVTVPYGVSAKMAGKQRGIMQPFKPDALPRSDTQITKAMLLSTRRHGARADETRSAAQPPVTHKLDPWPETREPKR